VNPGLQAFMVTKNICDDKTNEVKDLLAGGTFFVVGGRIIPRLTA